MKACLRARSIPFGIVSWRMYIASTLLFVFLWVGSELLDPMIHVDPIRFAGIASIPVLTHFAAFRVWRFFNNSKFNRYRRRYRS